MVTRRQQVSMSLETSSRLLRSSLIGSLPPSVSFVNLGRLINRCCPAPHRPPPEQGGSGTRMMEARSISDAGRMKTRRVCVTVCVCVGAALKVEVVYREVEAPSVSTEAYILIPAVLTQDCKIWNKDGEERKHKKKTASRDSSAPLFRSRGRPPTDEYSTHELTHFPQPNKCAGRCFPLTHWQVCQHGRCLLKNNNKTISKATCSLVHLQTLESGFGFSTTDSSGSRLNHAFSSSVQCLGALKSFKREINASK